MKNVFIYATCQGEAIGKILNTNTQFVSIYNINEIVPNYKHIQKQQPFVDDINKLRKLKDADVFIYQPLDDVYKKHSTNYLISLLKPTCIKISIPYVVINSLTPFIISMKGDLNDEWFNRDGYTVVIKNIEPIEQLVMKGLSQTNILALFDNNKIDWNFNERHKHTIEYLRSKEKNTNIKVCDYIEQNLSKKRLFCHYSHPTSDLLVYMVNQILKILDLNEINNIYSETHFLGRVSTYQLPTCSVKHFNLNFVNNDETIIANNFYKSTIIKILNKK